MLLPTAKTTKSSLKKLLDFAQPIHQLVRFLFIPRGDRRRRERRRHGTPDWCAGPVLQELEPRQMLYGYIGVHGEGPIYVLNTETYSVAAPGLVSLVSGSNPPFSTYLASGPSDGTVSIDPDGAWTYTANAGYVGSDQFSYYAKDSQGDQSGDATVTLTVGPGALSAVDQTSVPADSMQVPMQILGSSSGQPATAANLSLEFNSSTAQPTQTLAQDFQPSMSPAVAATFVAGGTFNGSAINGTWVTTSNLSESSPVIRLSNVVDTNVPTGRYADSQTVSGSYQGTEPLLSTVNGAVNVVNDQSSPFGTGWDMPGLYHIFPNSASGVAAGALLTTGDGSGWYFTQGSGNSYTSPNGPEAFSTLVSLTGGGWQLTDQYGTVYTFNSSGYLVTTELRTTQTTTYGWTNGDLTSITDAVGRSVTLAYTNGLLSSITNFAGSVWSFAYTGTTLTSITEPDPGTGAPVWSFGYNGNLMTGVTDPDSNASSYAFNSYGNLSGDTLPGGAAESYQFQQNYGVGGGPNDPANAVLSSTVENSTTDANGNTSYYTTDKIGNITSSIDTYGNVTTYTRDQNGLVTQLTQPPPAPGDAAPVTNFTYDSLGNETSATGANPSYGTYVYNSFSEPTSFTDAENNTQTWSYDSHGNLISETDPLNNVSSYTVDSLGNVLTMAQPAPNDGTGTVTTTYTRDQYERVTKITFPDNTTESFAYNTIDLPTSVTDQDGNTTVTAYDVLGRVASVTNAATGVTSTTYDADGNVVTSKNPLGNVTSYQYNDRDELIQETLPAAAQGHSSPVLAWTYDNDGNTLTYTNALSGVTTYVYDKLNRVTSETLPAPAQGQSGPETTFGYDNLSHKISETTALGTTAWAYANTDVNQLASETLPPPSGSGQGPTTTYVYDADGRQNTVTNAMNQTTTTTFTADGRVASVKDNVGDTTTYSYGHGGELLSTTDALSHTTSDEYDSRYRLIQTTDANGGVTEITLDGVGNETKLVDSANNATTWTFNALNEPLTETNSLGTTTTGYNVAGQVTSIEDADGRVRDFLYDNDGQLTTENWMSGSTVVAAMNYGYDLAGDLTSASDPSSAYAFAYDGDGNALTVDNNDTPDVPHVVLTEGYDALGDRTSLSATIAGTADFLNTYSYDDDQNLTMVQQQQQTGGNAVAPKEVDYSYNSLGEFTSMVYYNYIGDGPRTDVATGAFTYDNDGRLAGLAYTSAGGANTIDTYGWTYNAGNLVTSFTTKEGTASYSYDPTNQLTGATYTGTNQPANESYSYDKNGNRNMTGYSTGSDNLTSSDGTYNYMYDADGNRTTRTAISASYSTDYKTTYTWDYRNRLTDVEDYDNNGLLTDHVHYVYDVFDHLIATEVDPTGGGTYTEIQHYVLDVSPEIPAAGVPGTATAAPVLVFDGSGNLIGRNLVALNAAGVDAVIVQGTVTSGTQPDSDDWALTDNLGSLRIVLDKTSSIIDEIVYNSFGQVAYESSPTVAHWAGFEGGHVDANSGLVNDYHRWYDPATGKWLNNDPSGFSAGDTDLSRYVGNASTDFSDPAGLEVTAPPPPGPTAKPPVGWPEGAWYQNSKNWLSCTSSGCRLVFVKGSASFSGASNPKAGVVYIYNGAGEIVAQSVVTYNGYKGGDSQPWLVLPYKAAQGAKAQEAKEGASVKFKQEAQEAKVEIEESLAKALGGVVMLNLQKSVTDALAQAAPAKEGQAMIQLVYNIGQKKSRKDAQYEVDYTRWRYYTYTYPAWVEAQKQAQALMMEQNQKQN